MSSSLMFSPVKYKPLYTQIADQLRDELNVRYQPGEMLPSERELATSFAVSISTIREALSILQRDGYVVRKRGIGTQVLERRRLNEGIIAVLCDIDLSLHHISDFYVRLPQLLRKKLEARGEQVRLYFGNHCPGDFEGATTCKQFLLDLEQERLRGIVCVSGVALEQWQPRAYSLGIPVVGVNGGNQGRVKMDIDGFIRAALNDLWAKGCRKFGAVFGLPAAGDSKVDSTFEAALKQGVADIGGRIRQEWICRAPIPSARGAGWEGFRQIWLNGEEHPDGLIVGDDMLCDDVVAAIIEMNVEVPRQLQIASWMNSSNKKMLYPIPLTFYPMQTEQVADQLIALLDEYTKKRRTDSVTVTMPAPATRLECSPYNARLWAELNANHHNR